MSDCIEKNPHNFGYPLEDGDGHESGSIEGHVFHCWEDLSPWLVQKRVSNDEIMCIKRTTSLYPVAILNRIHVDAKKRQQGLGTHGMTLFYEIVHEEGAKTSVIVVDSREEQTPGFSPVRWFEKNGFASIGGTDTGRVVMFKRFN